MACKRLNPFFFLLVVAAGILACGSGSSPGMPDGRTPGDRAIPAEAPARTSGGKMAPLAEAGLVQVSTMIPVYSP